MMTAVTNLQQRLLVSHQVVQQRLLVRATRHVASHEHVTTAAVGAHLAVECVLQQRQLALAVAPQHLCRFSAVHAAAVAAAGVQQLAATGHYTQRCTHYMISFQSAMHAFHYVLELYQNSSKTVGN